MGPHWEPSDEQKVRNALRAFMHSRMPMIINNYPSDAFKIKVFVKEVK